MLKYGFDRQVAASVLNRFSISPDDEVQVPEGPNPVADEMVMYPWKKRVPLLVIWIEWAKKSGRGPWRVAYNNGLNEIGETY